MKTKLFPLVLMAAQLQLSAGSGEDYTAHEWGTFTSVQGADGVQLEWNPLLVSELPGFVYDRNRPHGGSPRGRVPRFAQTSSKSGFMALQRMETPVIYFYSPTERTVDVTVKFPQGLITEWFPQVRVFGPSTTSNKADAELARQSCLRWDRVQILAPPPQAAPALPFDPSGSHYYAARATDANALRVVSSRDGIEKTELEKFLFYRGLGSFQAPLRVTLGGNEDYVNLFNSGSNELRHLYVLNVKGAEGKFLYVARLPGGESTTVKLAPEKNRVALRDLRGQIGERMGATLAQEGLYPREAAAMVQTWTDSWFDEQGLRVLYTLPREWTDRVLPLTLQPAPHALVRVMVGRAEVITPTMEWELLKQIVQFSDPDEDAQLQAVAETRQLGLGRFTEPAVRRVLGRTPSLEFSQLAWNLMQEASRPETKPLAAK